MKGDLIKVYKMLNGRYDSDIMPPLALQSEVKIRREGTAKTYIKKGVIIVYKEIRRKFLRNKTIPFWNDFPKKVIKASSTKSFEKRLDKFWSQFNIKYNFDKCIDFQKQKSGLNYATTGNRRTQDVNLEIEAD